MHTNAAKTPMPHPPEPPPAPAHPLAEGIRGLHHSSISAANQRAVLMIVATTPGITNAEISRRAGLGAQTVSRFLADLENDGLIRRGEVKRGQPGLPATPYFLIYDSAFDAEAAFSSKTPASSAAEPYRRTRSFSSAFCVIQSRSWRRRRARASREAPLRLATSPGRSPDRKRSLTLVGVLSRIVERISSSPADRSESPNTVEPQSSS